MRKDTLSQSSFDRFLEVLDPNRERAGRKYEALRIRLFKFFEWRAYQFPEDLTDETLDRVMKRIAAGEKIDDHVGYTYGVARLVYLEAIRKQVRENGIVIEGADSNERCEYDSQLDCLETCLEKLSENSRTVILQYYRNDKQAKIDHRKKIAENLQISMNALRIKALRIRSKLEECVFKCLKNDPA